MVKQIASVIVETTDVQRLVEFWAALLEVPFGVDPASGWGQVVADSVCVMAKPVTAEELPGLEKGSRVHMDIVVDDLQVETEKALALGATVKRGPFGQEETGQYTVFADVDGNAFCLYTDPTGQHAGIIEAIRNGTIGSAAQ